jgi:hypothetical protein
VEYDICDLKHYKIIGTLWRHPRRKLSKIVELCGAFVRRRQTTYIIFHFYFVFRYQTVQFPAFSSYTIAENLFPGYAQFAASI